MNDKDTGFISSTPHPQRNKILYELFENDTLSPIIEPRHVKEIKPALPKSKAVKTSARINVIEPKKRKLITKDKDLRRSAISQEKNVPTNTASSANGLSQTRNIYNIYPEPIILDSDEEDEYLKTRNSYKNTPKKKVDNNSREIKVKKNRSERTVKNKSIILKDEKKNSKHTKREASKTKRNDTSGVTNNPESEGAAHAETLEKNCHTESVRNVQATRKKTKVVKKTLSRRIFKQSPSIIVLDEKSPFSQCVPGNFSKTIKRNALNITPNFKDLIDEDAIKWTPRISKKVKSVKNQLRNIEDLEDKENCTYKEIESVGIASSNPTDNTSTVVRKCKETECCNQDVQCNKEETKTTEKSFPSGCLSRFENVVFQRNTHSGGIVANCLQTDGLKLGYIEIKEGETFIGQRPHVTFVVLEGQVKARLKGTSQVLSSGDMLHCDSDSKYHFHNHKSDQARLLYVKEKQR